MAKTANVVIGANFGDEGKGRLTDHYSRPDTVVVRFNGGAQAGHTVISPTGQRHVFGHFGSGTFKGAKTYLSQYFIVNPILWDKEERRIKSYGIQPYLIVDPLAPLTTPYDMIINQMVEEWRAESGEMHGTCGVGINETITRNQYPEFATQVRTISQLRKKLDAIRFEYVPYRFEQLTGSKSNADNPYIKSKPLVDNFIALAETFRNEVIYGDDRIITTAEHVVFEGAQGLLLDEEHRWFPHVTRSRTGLTNAYRLAQLADVEELNVTYVTRAYLTRHGAGPLPNERPDLSPYDIVDPTNVPNAWQGTLRYAYLNVDMLADSIQDDLEPFHSGTIRIVYDVAITCMDQVRGEAYYHREHELCREPQVGGLIRPVFEACGITEGLVSYSPRGDLYTVRMAYRNAA